MISGGASGPGATIALRLVEGGATVWSLDRVLPERKALLVNDGQGDITAVDEVAAFAHEVQQTSGRVDLLVDSAGIGGPAAPLQDIDPGAWRSVLGANLTCYYS